MAQKTVERMLDKVSRLYEQGADEFRIETYLKRWWQWVRSGVDRVVKCEHTAEQSRSALTEGTPLALALPFLVEKL